MSFHRYEKTGVLAVDMVANAIDFYTKRNRKIKQIYLSRKLWNEFSDFVKRKAPEYIFTDEIDFDDVLIRESRLSLTPMHCIFEKVLDIVN